VLFSSLISDDNRKKGQQVGADVQVSKPELRETVMLVDKVVSGRIDEVRATANAQAAAA
jgi:two-component system chemotaxis response regulator CheV